MTQCVVGETSGHRCLCGKGGGVPFSHTQAHRQVKTWWKYAVYAQAATTVNPTILVDIGEKTLKHSLFFS
jgi:hypothetical protein